jgi:ABC-2 type transport system permease protein
MTAFATHFGFDFRTGIRNRGLLLLNYLFPLAFYFMMGFVMTEINPLFRDVLLPAMVVFAIYTAAILGLPDPLVQARDAGIFRSYMINGVPKTSILSIPALTTSMHLVIVTIMICITAPLLFDAPALVNWVNFAIVFLATLFACAGLGVLIGVISPNSRVTVLLSQLIFLPSMLIGGLMLPSSMLPAVPQKAALLLPSTHAMNAFKGLAMWPEVPYLSGSSSPAASPITHPTADFWPWGSVIVLLAGGLTAFGLAFFLFRWDSQHTKRRLPVVAALLALLPYAASIIAFA